MTLELLKLVIQPVVLERDESGRIVGERVGEPVALYTPEHVIEYVDVIRNGVNNGGGVMRETPTTPQPGDPIGEPEPGAPEPEPEADDGDENGDADADGEDGD